MKRGFIKRLLSGAVAMAMAFTVLCSDIFTEHNIASAAVPENFAVDYDPNDGLIHYGHYGEVGMRVEKDLNNDYFSGEKVVKFPQDVCDAVNDDGSAMFPDYNENDPYYDYSDMLNYAVTFSKKYDNADIFISDGVYYFEKPIYLNNGGTCYTSFNARAGKVAFVIKPYFKDIDGNDVEVNGFFTNSNLSENYAWFANSSISDIVFVVEDTHPAFKPTSSARTIMDNLFSDDIQPVDNFELFYRIRMKYAGISNIAAAGFNSFMRWTYPDMLTRVTNCSVGPTRIVFNGVQTNDAFFYDNYFYGGYYTDHLGLQILPMFQENFSLATTYISNSYIKNYCFSRSGAAGCWAPYNTYSNITFERVYNFVCDTTSSSSSSVSACLFKDGAYNDIAEYFESLGIEPFNYHDRYYDHENKKWVYPDHGYAILDSYTSDRYMAANHSQGQSITLIELLGGTCFTQNKIECDSLDWTILVRISDSEWTLSFTGSRPRHNINFSDNAFKINEYVKEKLLIDDWRGGKPLSEGWSDKLKIEWGIKYYKPDGTAVEGWIGVQGDKDVCWMDDHIYVSPSMSRYIDLSAFKSPDVPTAGYASLGAVGADEQQLIDWGIEEKYYNDLQSGMEIVYLQKDFGASAWNTADNYSKLQTAFDYIATHDAILYIESGTYYTNRPIILRGGATYRVFSNGTIKAGKTDAIKDEGVFAMSADDNAPINGYYYGVNLDLLNAQTSAFFNVNTDKFLFEMDSVQRGVGCFTNCKLKNTVINSGTIQYCDYGFFYKTVTDNTLLKNVYGTASTWVEGEDGITPGDINYRYFISDSDFKNSTWRSCWLEFGQFSNGRKLSGDGNSVYRGNIIDYTYNYSFGRNDVVVGNTMTRAAYSQITNHMTGSNFPIDLPDALTNKYMVMYHISDGLRLIGNMDIGAMCEQTHFIEFDSPTIRYEDENGNEVISISDVRIAGNGATTTPSGEWKKPRPMVPYDRADNIVFENCRNNQIMLMAFYLYDQDDDPATTDINEEVRLTTDIVKEWSIPYTRIYVNDELLVVDYPQNAQPEELDEITTPQPPQDEMYDVPNVWDGTQQNTEFLLYDFKDRTPAQLEALYEKFEGYIDNKTIVAYKNSSFNKAVLPDSNGEVVPFDYYTIKNLSKEQRLQILRQTLIYNLTKSPSGENSFYMSGQRQKLDFDGTTNDGNNTNRPTYAITFRDENISGDTLKAVELSAYYNTQVSYAWQGKRPWFIIYSEDENYYYGLVIGYAASSKGLFSGEGKVEKNYMDKLTNFGQAHFETGLQYDQNKLYSNKMYESLSGIICPEEGYNFSVYGDFTTIPLFDGVLQNYEGYNLGIDISLEYNDAFDSVDIYATVDFTDLGVDTSVKPELIATTREVYLGSHPLNNTDKIFGIWNSDETWVESVQFEYTTQTPSGCNHSYEDEITREGSCSKDAVIRHTCTLCGHEYQTYEDAHGHDFRDGVDKTGKTLRTCIDCGLQFYVDTPMEYPARCGDVNADTLINLRDVVLLYQHVSKWKVKIDIDAAQTDGIGSVNLRDVVLLYQYVSNWNVKLAE